MTSPITTPNLDIRYGYWTGSKFSAGSVSPSFVPYTDAEIAVSGIDGFDNFASKPHDLAYERAQNTLVDNLVSGMSLKQALSGYLTAIRNADIEFVNSAEAASTANTWGDSVKQIGINAMDFKAEAEAVRLSRLNDASDDYLSDMSQLYRPSDFQALKAAQDNYIAYTQFNPTDTSSAEYLALKSAVADAANASALLEHLSKQASLVADTVPTDPTLAADLVANAADIATFGYGSDIIDALANLPAGQVAGLVGDTFGSLAVQMFGGTGFFKQVGGRTLGGEIGRELATLIVDPSESLLLGNPTTNQTNLFKGAELGLDGTAGIVGTKLTVQAGNVLGTILISELAEELGLEGFEGQAFTTAGGTITGANTLRAA